MSTASINGIMTFYFKAISQPQQCWVHNLDPSSAGLVYMRNLSLVSTVSADIVAPNGARSSAGTVLTTKPRMKLFPLSISIRKSFVDDIMIVIWTGRYIGGTWSDNCCSMNCELFLL